jgi:hypothetical protein
LNILMYDIFITVTDQARKRETVSIRRLYVTPQKKNVSVEFDKTSTGGNE